MRIQYLGLVLVGAALVLLISRPAQAESPPLTPEAPDEPLVLVDEASENYLFDPKEVVSRSAATAGFVGEQIDVAVSDTYDETSPAVALCAHDQYLAVYTREGKIYGQRLANDGDLLGSAFLISSDDSSSHPDVACDWSYDRFIVVWDYDYYGDGSDYDVGAQGVWGWHQSSGSQLYGDRLDLSSDGGGIDEQQPAIACNSESHSCLVVFEYNGTGSGDIYGRRVQVGDRDIYTQGARFSIGSFGVVENNPDVAWGGFDDDYLVVWQYQQSTPSSHYRIVTAYIWDTNQAGSQIETIGSWLIGPGSFDHDQTAPVAAYDHYTRQYLAVFQYDYNGAGSDHYIAALRLKPGGGSVGDVFPIARTGYRETGPAVAFSGGTQSISGGMGADEFLVTYIADSSSVLYGQAVKGTFAASGDQLRGDPVELDRTLNSINYGLFNPDVTGSINNGRYMVVWEDYVGGFAGSDYDILGQMVAPYAVHLYLPLVLRDSP